MTCHVIISDYVIRRRMTFVLDQLDFTDQSKRWGQTDDVLMTFKDHPFFAGCDQWTKLDLRHYHALIINILHLCGEQPDDAVTNKQHPMVARLLFLLCSLITLIEQRSGAKIDLLRVNRVCRDDVMYDYSARMEVIVAAPKTALRMVIDND